MSSTAPRPDQFAGCLIGQCLGDALGFPVEGMPRDVCRDYVESGLRADPVRPRSHSAFPFGQYTDDSQLARELLVSYAERRGFVAEDYASRIADIFAAGRIVGRGRATEAAARRLIRGVPWREAGTPPPAAGNGSAMRAGPVGLLFGDAPGEMIRVATEQGMITHRDPRCVAGSIAIAGAVALAMQDKIIDGQDLAGRLVEWTSPASEEFARCLSELPEWLELTPDDALGPISRAGLANTADAAWPGVSPFVVGSVIWSLYSFLRSPDDYWETICTAISAGGDVDTTAAMAGAISGARLGLDALPRDLARRVEDQGDWSFDELRALAENAHAVYAERVARP